ncbi:MAG: ABC transporter ATP-binding protein [Pseudobdellovibrionaceae bacterium]
MLALNNISKSFSNQIALQETDLNIREGEFFSLLGPSGCGKTTLLRILAGFETPTQGQVLLEGKNISNLAPADRPFNMVFQKYALFPHLTVYENVAFGLKMKKTAADEIQRRVREMLQMVGLKDYAERMPETLSGGQSQRVAVARALVNQPKVLLLDEPLSALDLKMREHMQIELKTLQRKLGLTFIFVTHDQEEAFALSDRIAVMNKGCIEQVSSPQDLYERPQTRFVAEFIGHMNKLPNYIMAQPEARKEYFIRSEKIFFKSQQANSICTNVQVLQKTFRGDHDEWQVELSDHTLLRLKTPVGAHPLSVSDRVEICFDEKDVFSFEEES